MTGGDQRRAIVDADPGYPLQCQHAAAGAPPIDPRHAKIRVAGEILGELRGGGGLEAQIHLEPNDLGQHLYHLDGLQPPQHRLQALAQRASHRKRSRSRANASTIPGRKTLTATSCPSVVRAK